MSLTDVGFDDMRVGWSARPNTHFVAVVSSLQLGHL